MTMKTTNRTFKWSNADGATFEVKASMSYPVADVVAPPPEVVVPPPVVTPPPVVVPPPVVTPPIISPPPTGAAEVFLNPGDDVVAAARRATKDTILYLRDGAYGPLRFDNFLPPGTITLRAVNRRKARVQQVLMQGSADVTLDQLAMWDEPTDRAKQGVALLCQHQNKRFHVSDCEFRGHPDLDYFAWDKAKWNAAGSAGSNDAVDGSIKNCLATGVSFGFQVGNNVVLEGNKVKGFCGDGLRAFGSAKVRNNYASDNFLVSENHNDMLQSFNLTGVPFEGMEIIGNTLVSWAGPTDHPLRVEGAQCQGIGFFDGFWNNLIMRDNLIVTDTWHGISVYGATNSVIENNIALNVYGKDAQSGGRPWIRLVPHKDGRPSDNVVFRDNKAVMVSNEAANTRITQSGNVNLTPAETQTLLDLYAARIRQ